MALTPSFKTHWLLAVLGGTFTGCLSVEQPSAPGSKTTAALECLSVTASLVAFSDTQVELSGNSDIAGNVLLLGGSELTASGNARVRNAVVASSMRQVQSTGNAILGDILEADLTVNEPAAMQYIQSLRDLPSGSEFSLIAESQAFEGRGAGLNVVQINGDLTLAGQAKLTLHGYTSDFFVIRVAGSFTISGQAGVTLEGGIPARNVLFLIEGARLHLNGQGNIAGTFVLPRGSASLTGKGRLTGSVFALGSLRVSGNGLSVEPAAFCPGRMDPPAVEPTPCGTPTTEPSPEPTPTVSPTPVPTPDPTPEPSASPDCSLLSCGGGVIGI